MLLRVFVHLFVFLKLCGATDISCTVTQDGERTLYSVPEYNGTECIYQWRNITKHVLANEVERTVGQVVVLNTNWTLGTNECLKQIIYSRTCFPEWVQQMATCTSNCSGNSAVPIGDIAYRIVPGAISVVLLLLVLLVLLCSKFRDRILRCPYTPVKTQEDSSTSSDVEEQR